MASSQTIASSMRKQEEEMIFLQQQQLIMYQIEQNKKSTGSSTLRTVEDDGLSVLKQTERPDGDDATASLSMSASASMCATVNIAVHEVPDHIRREQEVLLERVKSQRSTSSSTAPTRRLSRANLQEASTGSMTVSSSRNRVRPRSFSVASVSAASVASLSASAYDEQIAHSASTEHMNNLDGSVHSDSDIEEAYAYGNSSVSVASSLNGSSQYHQPLHPTPGVPTCASLPSPHQQHHQSRVDWEAKQQTHIPEVQQALRARQRQSTTSNRTVVSAPEPPRADSGDEIDVDELIIERVQSSIPKVRRTSHLDYDSYRVGAFNIRNAGEPPVHPNDRHRHRHRHHTRSHSQRSMHSQTQSAGAGIPSVIQQHCHSTASTITQLTNPITTLSEPIPSVLHTDDDPPTAVLVEEPCDLPLPAIIVHSTDVRITAPPDPEGAPNSPSKKDQKQPPPTEQKSTLTYVLGGTGCFAFFGGICLLLFLYVPAFEFVGICKVCDETPSPTPAPTTAAPSLAPPTQPATPAPTPEPTPIVLNFPNHTIDAILKSGSPQASAYKWLVQDIQSYPNRTVERQYQRFALATLYFATNFDIQYSDYVSSVSRDAWTRSGGWLDHDMNECEWETVGTTGRRLPIPYRVCNPETSLYESLVLEDNGLRGFIPAELSFITTLQYLDVGRNDLQYADLSLPTQLGLLTNLEHFSFFYSYGEGPIPSEIGRLSNLKMLSLERNKFQGTIPTEVGLLLQLDELILEWNQLEGQLPSELGMLLARDLWELNVETNVLTGTIPSIFNDAMEIRKSRHGERVIDNGNSLKVRFGKNWFDGRVPDEMCSLLQRLDFDCDPEEGLCGCERCECGVGSEVEPTGSPQTGNPDNPDLP